MKEYYIYLQGKQEGPFTLEELGTRRLTRDTPVWYPGAVGWMPASAMEELKHFFPDQPPPVISAASRAPAKRGRSWRLLIIAIFVFAAGVSAYFLIKGSRHNTENAHKERVRTIHQQEVQKAIRELKTERRRQRDSLRKDSLRKVTLRARHIELRSLQRQLADVQEQLEDAASELRKIRRPRLFRSRNKKESQIAAQEAYIASLESRERNIRNRINNCLKEIDKLSAPAAVP